MMATVDRHDSGLLRRGYQGLLLDVLIVGAGFGAFTILNRLRKLGLQVTIYEKGAKSGGIWYWNCYPGARVDSDTPIYQLFDKELWEDFTFKERYAGWQELRRYFDHIEKKWEVKKHIVFDKHVDGAHFDEQKHQWLVECADGGRIYCKWFLPCIGFASRRYTPPINGLSNFQGDVYHTAVWPQHGVNLKNKRIAVIGTGASGIQVIQEVGDAAKELTCYIRTPNFCLPMKQRKLDPDEEERKKKNGDYDKAFADTRKTFAGFTYDFIEKNTFDDPPEEREKFFHKLMVEEGGFRYWLNTYKDMLFDQKANDEAYNFWMKTVRKRIPDPEKQKILAPEKPPHPWGTKRPSLEQHFYETISKDHVELIDVNQNPIEEVTPTGLKTSKGVKDIDVLILATGFDSVTGSLAQLDIVDTDGGTIADHWKDRLQTSMGIAIPKFPNMFFLYGPQAPTAFSNGPSCTQFQAEFVEEAIKRAEAEGITRMESKKEVEDDWCERMSKEWDATLFPLAKSWYSGANIPGKRVEPLNWAGGMVEYCNALHGSLENDYQGWKVEKLTV
nr:baeyer-villiger monooxygenase [Quercus suber]